MDQEPIDSLASELVAADHAVAFTGAGVSTASGIPDFRSEGGIWEEFDQGKFHYSRFKAEPGAYWADRLELRESMYGDRDIEPNPAHEAFAALEHAGLLEAVITQNVDDLHEAAGSEAVIHLHGTSSRVVCQSCGERFPADVVDERAGEGELPPRCDACDGVLKPDTILFGEQLPVGALQAAKRHARDADVFICAGSSLTVEPAASLPLIAARHDSTLAIVNLDSTPLSPRADYDVRADVTEALPTLVDAVGVDERDGLGADE